jgi:hypothetical protein
MLALLEISIASLLDMNGNGKTCVLACDLQGGNND